MNFSKGKNCGEENAFDLHNPDREVCIVPEEVTGAAVAWENR